MTTHPRKHVTLARYLDHQHVVRYLVVKARNTLDPHVGSKLIEREIDALVHRGIEFTVRHPFSSRASHE